jgi:hypothetical protein
MAINWDICLICQTDTEEALRCPKTAAGSGSLSTYSNFLERCNKFREVEALPFEVKFGSEITAEDFQSNDAKWHHSCYLKFNNKALTKAEKRKSSTSSSSEAERRSTKHEKTQCQCLFSLQNRGN